MRRILNRLFPARRAILRVERLHRPRPIGSGRFACKGCNYRHPCPTRQVLGL